ncbi:hypothetical protein PEC18_34940 [Paucibacter sp. O1-1]|nr:hypothetical protein [Paucibacter sp. O1-1]MDA3830873.1 hypothetical protein [Paucibacter sp. O1-1]
MDGGGGFNGDPSGLSADQLRSVAAAIQRFEGWRPGTVSITPARPPVVEPAGTLPLYDSESIDEADADDPQDALCSP